MHLSTLLTGCFILIATQVFGQLRLDVIWKTDDGSLETGKMRYYGLKSPEDFRITKLIKEDDDIERFVFKPGSSLEWAVHQQDTVIRRYSYRGNNHYVQLLYTGEVQLYKVITTQYLERYFLVRNHQWHHIQNSAPREAVYNILRQNCKGLQLPSRVRNAQDAMEICRQMNECLGAETHYSYLKQWTARNELGISYDYWANRGVNDGPYTHKNRYGIHIAHYGLETHIPIVQRKLSITYNRHLFRYYPNILGQLNSSIVSFNIKERSDLNPHRSQRYAADEHLAMTVWYLDPGLEFRTGYQKRFQFLLGLGIAFAVPIYSKRTVEQINPTETLPGKPIFQEARNLIKTKPGYHFHFGFTLNFGEMDIAARIRYHRLEQNFRHRDESDVLYSNLFPTKTWLGERDHKQLQIRLQYTW